MDKNGNGLLEMLLRGDEMVNIILFPYDCALLKLIWLFSQSSSTNFLQISDFLRKERQTFMDHLYQSMQYHQKTNTLLKKFNIWLVYYFYKSWRYNFTHHGVLESSYLKQFSTSLCLPDCVSTLLCVHNTSATSQLE